MNGDGASEVSDGVRDGVWMGWGWSEILSLECPHPSTPIPTPSLAPAPPPPYPTRRIIELKYNKLHDIFTLSTYFSFFIYVYIYIYTSVDLSIKWTGSNVDATV